MLPEIGQVLSEPLITLECVGLCKRDGERLAAPVARPGNDPSGLRVWQKLMVYAGEQSRHFGRPDPRSSTAAFSSRSSTRA